MLANELVSATAAKLGSVGAVHYFDQSVLSQAKQHGLDGMRMYFLGRGGVLGDVESHVVWGAFGYFNPAVVAKMWNSAKEIMAPRDASRAYLRWAAELGDKLFADVAGLDAFNAAAARVLAEADPASLPLYAGYAEEPAPESAAGAAIFHAIALRELRGSVHLLALVASGVDPLVAHAHRRPDDAKLFGYEELPAVTNTDRALIEEADRLTDSLMARHYSLLTAEECHALAAGTDALHAALPQS